MEKIRKLINRDGKKYTALKIYEKTEEEHILKDMFKTLNNYKDLVRVLVWEDYIDITLKNNATPVTFYFVQGYTSLILNKIRIYCKLHNIEYREVSQ